MAGKSTMVMVFCQGAYVYANKCKLGYRCTKCGQVHR